VTVARTYEGDSVISDGLADGEVVVTDGQLLLNNGSKVAPRPARAGT
jgi:multidrug efflux pump subunit AcrA (membrane-fusion protein)